MVDFPWLLLVYQSVVQSIINIQIRENFFRNGSRHHHTRKLQTLQDVWFSRNQRGLPTLDPIHPYPPSTAVVQQFGIFLAQGAGMLVVNSSQV